MTTWLILVAPIDTADAIETVELVETDGHAFVGEAGVTIWTNADGMGGFRDERVIPWRRILDYKKTSP